MLIDAMTSALALHAANALAVPVAMAVDHWLGEPPPRWHPVVWMGRVLNAAGAPWPQAAPQRAFVFGALAWAAGALLCVALAAAAAGVVSGGVHRLLAATLGGATVGLWLGIAWHALLPGLLLGVLLKPLLAWRMLHDEVAAVEQALASGGVVAGRARLTHLVSRDTATLSAAEVRESALESLSENLNDSLLAPLFWFAVAGLPGAALYRFANTADAMWGYRGRWEWAGKWAARADDVLSCLPARLTALLVAAAAGRWPHGLAAEARHAPSPNGGWPMAALALLLTVRLGKPGVYVLNAGGAAPGADAVDRALRLCRRAAWGAAALATVVLALPALWCWLRMSPAVPGSVG